MLSIRRLPLLCNRVISIGVELEGGMNEGELDLFMEEFLNDGLHLERKTDASVSVRGKDIQDLELTMWVYRKDLPKLEYALRKLYEYGFKVNESCGLHVHLRFEDMNKAFAYFSYQIVQDMFVRKYRERFGSNRRYRERLNNLFCKTDYDLVAIVRSKFRAFGDRHKFINLKSVVKHNTIEFRCFPAGLDAMEVMEDIYWLLDTVEEWMVDRLEYKVTMNIPILEEVSESVLCYAVVQ